MQTQMWAWCWLGLHLMRQRCEGREQSNEEMYSVTPSYFLLYRWVLHAGSHPYEGIAVLTEKDTLESTITRFSTTKLLTRNEQYHVLL